MHAHEIVKVSLLRTLVCACLYLLLLLQVAHALVKTRTELKVLFMELLKDSMPYHTTCCY